MLSSGEAKEQYATLTEALKEALLYLPLRQIL